MHVDIRAVEKAKKPDCADAQSGFFESTFALRKSGPLQKHAVNYRAFTSLKVSTISFFGAAVDKLTATMNTQATKNAGSSS